MMTPRRVFLLFGFAGLFGLATCLSAACSGSEGSQAGMPTTTAAVFPDNGFPNTFADVNVTDLVSCIRAAGFEVTDDAASIQQLFNPDGNSDPAFSQQLASCAAEQGVELPSALEGRPTRPDGVGSFDPSILTTCLSNAGVDVPPEADPVRLLGSLDRNDPKVQTALRTCGLGTP